MFDSDELLERIIEHFKTGKGRPFMLELRPTNICNLRCPSCVARGYPQYTQGEELSGEEYLRIIDEAAGLGVRYVQIVGGGEPFTQKEKLLPLMRRIKHHMMTGFMMTNGTLFDVRIIRTIVALRWDALFISLDGPSPALNDFLRGKRGVFEKATRAIRALVDLRTKNEQDEPRITLGPVLSHHNCRSIPDFMRLAGELGVDNVIFQPIRVPMDERGKEFLLTPEDGEAIVELIPEGKRLAETLGLRTNLDDLDATMIGGSSRLPEVIQAYTSGFTHPWLSVRCFAPWFYIGINAGGRAGPCSVDDKQTYVLDVRKHPLKDIWEGQTFSGLRQRLLRQELPEICEKCCGTNVLEIKKIRERLRGVIRT